MLCAHDCAGLAYPVVLKIVSPDIAHKSDVGGVRLDIDSAEALLDAAARMVVDVCHACPDARLSGLLVAPMVDGALETLVGVVNDPAFGPVVAFGLGGVLAEVLHDMSYRVAPFDAVEARSMIDDLRGRALFDGVRGSAPLDVGALATVLEQEHPVVQLLVHRSLRNHSDDATHDALSLRLETVLSRHPRKSRVPAAPAGLPWL